METLLLPRTAALRALKQIRSGTSRGRETIKPLSSIRTNSVGKHRYARRAGEIGNCCPGLQIVGRFKPITAVGVEVGGEFQAGPGCGGGEGVQSSNHGACGAGPLQVVTAGDGPGAFCQSVGRVDCIEFSIARPDVDDSGVNEVWNRGDSAGNAVLV